MKKPTLTEATEREREPHLKPYATELGMLVIWWARLCDNLGKLFWLVTRMPNGRLPLSVWHAVLSDRTQRDIFRALVHARANSEKDGFPAKSARDDIVWLLDEVNKLADQRNDAIHAPLTTMAIGSLDKPMWIRVEANDWFGNPRAKKLKEKDLLIEFKWYRAKAEVLSDYAWALSMSLDDSSIPWPERPSLPARGQKNVHQDRHHPP